MDQFLHVTKVIERCFEMSKKFPICYSALNLPGIFWQMSKFENFITQVKGEKKIV